MHCSRHSTKFCGPSPVSGDWLDDGADLTGRRVEYWGHEWEVIGKNYLGDWDVVRFEEREDGRYRIKSSIAPKVLDTNHPHYARLLPPNAEVRHTGPGTSVESKETDQRPGVDLH